MLQSSGVVMDNLVKPAKIAIFGPNLQKRGQHGPHPQKFFLAEMTKIDHQLSETLYFTKILYVLVEL